MTPEPERHEGDLGHGGTLPTVAELTAVVRPLMDAAWRDDAGGGFCVPNPTTYPWQWLWDSCFHAVVWAHLGDERAIVELRSALSAQGADGFVPHLRYGEGPYPARGAVGTASVVDDHPAADVRACGGRADPVGDAAPPTRWSRRHSAGWSSCSARGSAAPGGLVELCHPWESGCDDSPRWDDTVPGGRTPASWFDHKGELVASIERTPSGAPIHNPAFPVGSVGFSALVAWNALELATITGDDDLAARRPGAGRCPRRALGRRPGDLGR